MGTFLEMVGVAQTEKRQVVDALRVFAKRHSGVLKPLYLWNFFVEHPLRIVASQQGHVTIIYPRRCRCEEASQHLSSVLMGPVFSLKIFDGDFWKYRLFANGDEVDHFNPIPDYFGELSEEELRSWAGDAAVVCQHWPNVAHEQISGYLTRWDDGEDGLTYFRNNFSEKAYPEDVYGKGEAEQVSDFMSKLGLARPWDEEAWLPADEYLLEIND